MMDQRLRVLLIEDNPTDAKLVLAALRSLPMTIEHHRVDSSDALQTALGAATWDVILSDWSLPGFSAMGALDLIEELKIDAPFIIVSGTIGEEAAAAAMRAGARDCVLKDRMVRLPAVIDRELREYESRMAQRRAETQLQQQSARFRALIENSSEGILLATREGDILYASPAAMRILPGLESSVLHLRRLTHSEDLPALEAFVHQAFATPGKSGPLEARGLVGDGSSRWIEWTLTNLLDDPDMGAIVVNLRDINAQRLAFEARRTSEKRFARLADSGIVGIVVADAMGRIFECNDAYLTMIGYTREEVLAESFSWEKLSAPGQEEIDARALQQLTTTGTASPWERDLIRKDGVRVPVLIGVAMLEPPVCITFIADLTERKRAEAALRGTEEQLRHAQKMEAVGRLAGGIAHDFNNALSVIMSYVGILLMDLEKTSPMRDDVEEIKKAADRAANLTRQLLLFSRQQIPQPRVLDLDEVVGQMDKMLHRLVGEDVDLHFNPGAPLGRVRIDPGYVEQIVMNLVVNARDAMPSGGTLTITTTDVDLDQVFVETHVGLKPGPYVMLSIQDTGTGMDKATQARIFEPFFTTKPVGQGTGLGLSTVFGIVQQSGGAIWVDSEVGQGTAFRVYLPRVTDRMAARTQSLVAHKGTETILLLEDEMAVRNVARSILRRSGYNVITAATYREALAIVEKGDAHIDLLLSDVVMPGQSGPEVAAALTRLQPGLKHLFMSGYTNDNVVRHGVLADQAFVQKPFTPESLTTAVRDALDRKPG